MLLEKVDNLLSESEAQELDSPTFLPKKMRSVMEVINLIQKNYQVEFVIEQITYDRNRITYYLKTRKFTKVLHLKWESFEYETNALNNRITFKSIDDIESYLRMQYSEPQGFRTESIDMN